MDVRDSEKRTFAKQLRSCGYGAQQCCARTKSRARVDGGGSKSPPSKTEAWAPKKLLGGLMGQPAEDFLRFFSGAAACACAEMARTGGFLPPAVVGVFSAMLFLRASIRSMTGASFGCSATAISWPWRFASIIFSMLSI